MQIPATLIGRKQDLEYIQQCGLDSVCCSLVGVSNLGKSALLRHLSQAQTKAGTFIYVDCNQMPERTARALFITAWQAVMGQMTQADVRAGAQHLYDAMFAAPSAMTVALNFSAGISFALDHLRHPLVLCFDEFDEAYQNLEPQAFLNLRALRDRHDGNLVYMTATERELPRLGNSREQGEFLELVTPHTYWMHFMSPDDTRKFCQAFAEREHVTFSADDLNFIAENADGHPGLAQAVCHVLGKVTGQPKRNQHQDRIIHQNVQQNLGNDENVRLECEKIWRDLEPEEQEALLHPTRTENAPAIETLRTKSILLDGDEPRVFSRLFDEFVRRQRFAQQPAARGVFVDVDAGLAWVDGKPIEGLTELEYRLLMFLYGRMDRLCDKYAIVESVWGQDYVDKVDDARIEKLVSRLRGKIETDPAHPRYLQSLRGRGYKLVR